MTVWTDTRKTQLRELWDRKPQLSAQQIGDIMGCTRNAIIGEAHRLELASRKRGATANAPKLVRKPRSTFRRAIVPRRPPAVILPFVAAPQEAVEPIPFSSLGKDTCRAVTRMGSLLYSSESMYCGAPVVPGKAWCQHHFVLYTEKRSRR